MRQELMTAVYDEFHLFEGHRLQGGNDITLSFLNRTGSRNGDPGDRLRQSVPDELGGVEDLEPRQMAELHPAAFAVGEDDLRLHPGDLSC